MKKNRKDKEKIQYLLDNGFILQGNDYIKEDIVVAQSLIHQTNVVSFKNIVDSLIKNGEVNFEHLLKDVDALKKQSRLENHNWNKKRPSCDAMYYRVRGSFGSNSK